jgi:hypothetical protein
MARQAEAERERRAKIINAEGEFQAAARLNDAADVISRNPVTIQLRYLQTLIEVSNNQSSTIVFPLPIDVLRPLIDAAQSRRASATDGTEPAGLDEALEGPARDPAPVASAVRPALSPQASEPLVPGVKDPASEPGP